MLLFIDGKFLRIIQTNAFALEEPSYEMQKKLFLNEKDYALNSYIDKRQIGTALYSHVSRFNHSCNPNVAFVFDNVSQKIVLCSARFIKKGEELNISYGPAYHLSGVMNITGCDRTIKVDRLEFFSCNMRFNMACKYYKANMINFSPVIY